MDQVMMVVFVGYKFILVQQQVMDKMKFCMFNFIRESINWEKMELVYICFYCEIFMEEEVQGMFDFYWILVGQVMIYKLLVLMQWNMDLMQ